MNARNRSTCCDARIATCVREIAGTLLHVVGAEFLQPPFDFCAVPPRIALFELTTVECQQLVDRRRHVDVTSLSLFRPQHYPAATS